MNRRNFVIRSTTGAAALTILTARGLSMINDDNNRHNDRYVIQPKDNRKALINPDMGWTIHYMIIILKIMELTWNHQILLK